MRQLERTQETALINDIKKLGGKCEKLKSVKTGWPDRQIFMPYGLTWFVELKKPKEGILSPRQKIVHRELRELGFKVRIVLDKESRDQFINEIKNAISSIKETSGLRV